MTHEIVKDLLKQKNITAVELLELLIDRRLIGPNQIAMVYLDVLDMQGKSRLVAA